MVDFHVFGIREVLYTEVFFAALNTLFRQRYVAFLFVYDKIPGRGNCSAEPGVALFYALSPCKGADEFICLLIKIGRLVSGA